MSTTHQSRRRIFGIIAVLALTLLAPVAVNAQDEVADLAPVAAPAAVGTSVDEVRATRALAAQNALQSGDIGSMQEDALRNARTEVGRLESLNVPRVHYVENASDELHWIMDG